MTAFPPDSGTPATVAPDAPRAGGHSSPRSLSQIVFTVGPSGATDLGPPPSNGTGAGEPAAVTLDDIVEASQRDFVRQTLAWVFERAEAFGFELHGLLPSHAAAWFQCCLVPNLAGGRVVSATMVATDITVYKQRELELERERDELRELAGRLAARAERPAPVSPPPRPDESAAFLGLVVDGLGDAIVVIDAGTQQILDVNQTACRWLHGTRQELLLRPAAEVSNGIPLVPDDEPDDPPFTQSRGVARAQVRRGVCRRSDGSVFPVQSTLSRVRLNGVEHIVAVVSEARQIVNVTEQVRDLAERYRSLLAWSSDGVVLLNRAGIVLEVNATAAALFGRPEREIVGRDIRHGLLFRPEAWIHFQERSARAEPAVDLPTRIRRPDEVRLAALLSTWPLQGPGGGVRGYQCVIRLPGRPPDARAHPGERGGT